MQKISPSKAIYDAKPDKPVFVISSDNKKPNGMICSWWSKISDDPAVVAVSLWKKGNTHKLILKSKEFVVAVPNRSLEKDLMFFGSNHGHKIDKFKETKIETEKAKFVGVPLLKKATYNFECKLVKSFVFGEMIVFFGKVVAAYNNPEKKVLIHTKTINEKRVFEEI
jgi:flavin reductase (DIM6/NTAB) family NADH-FMN oxidoreductase RutF